MSYRYSVIPGTFSEMTLAKLAVGVASQKLDLTPFPQHHFFTPDPAGQYVREVDCAGFIDFRSNRFFLNVFIRHGLTPTEIVKTAFHEVFHIHQCDQEPMALDEAKADRFASMRLLGSYQTIIEKLKAEFKPLSAADLKNMEWAMLAREHYVKSRERRKQQQEEHAEYVRVHWREIHEQREAQRQREIEKIKDQVRNGNDRGGGFLW